MGKVLEMIDSKRNSILHFFGELGRLMLRTFNHSFSKGELSSSQKQAIITLIQKKDRDIKIPASLKTGGLYHF